MKNMEGEIARHELVEKGESRLGCLIWFDGVSRLCQKLANLITLEGSFGGGGGTMSGSRGSVWGVGGGRERRVRGAICGDLPSLGWVGSLLVIA